MHKCTFKNILPKTYGEIEYFAYWINIEKHYVFFKPLAQKVKINQRCQLLEATFNKINQMLLLMISLCMI